MNVQLLAKLRNVSLLPSLPAIAVRVLELTRQTDVGVADVAKVISNDAALSAKVLRTVNSSFYALPMRVSTINHAASLLGLQSIKTLALGFSLVSSLSTDKSKGFDYNRFWRQSLTAAVASRLLARQVLPKLAEEAFVAGLLSDIGTLVMHRVLGREYDELLEKSRGNQIELVRLSLEKFDLEHAQVGGMLAEHWKLPEVLVEPIRQHHSLADKNAAPTNLVVIVHTSVLCAQVFAAKVTGLYKTAESHLRSRFEFQPAAIKQLFTEVHDRSAELAENFELRLDAGRSVGDIEDEARQMLMQLSLQAQMESTEALRINQQLEQQANTDGLTGLANRLRFDAFLEKSYRDAIAQKRPLGLLFLDVDRFKSINDTHGHQVGDGVLMRLAETIRSSIRSTDLAARYGGEEIAVVLPGADSKQAAGVAEDLRKRVAALPMIIQQTSVPVTVSIGIAANDQPNTYPTAAAMLAAADKAVYAAKHAGRNCTRLAAENG
ncbi:MAG TPA: HDOD domain-containing protein [Tepidisphaeraceae bacterium]|jgi:diguanylate cyclase (GGDEF)-like protein